MKSNDSENDQPNDNGFNALVKSKYNECKLEWDEEFVCTKFCPAHMNRVIVEMWKRTILVAARIINNSFKKCNLLPLAPPSRKEFVERACVASLQCGTGKKSAEMAVITDEYFNKDEIRTSETSDKMTIISSKHRNRNLLIRTSAYEIISRTLVAPAQKIIDISQEISNARQTKLNQARQLENTRLNPDTSTGLFVKAEHRVQARIVDENKLRHEKEKQEAKIVSENKKAVRTCKQKEAFERVRTTVMKNKSDNIHQTLSAHDNNDDIKLAFQYCGGILNHLPNKKRITIQQELADRFSDKFEEGVTASVLIDDSR